MRIHWIALGGMAVALGGAQSGTSDSIIPVKYGKPNAAIIVAERATSAGREEESRTLA
jgi:hypothetical protein